ncbi:MAG: thiamine pyrophosphate-dependent enzyme [Saprospiraceae bacterium]
MSKKPNTPILKSEKLSKENNFVQEVLKDFYTVCLSREASLLGRKEVLTGKAKFGILGDGKELPQVAMARAFKKGDWRAGYYRDQTFMLAIGEMSIENYFAQLYADAENDPFSGGRQMNSHFATQTIDENGNWLDLKNMYNISSDISCTGGQMARGIGLGFASHFFKSLDDFPDKDKLSNNGNEVCFVTIGDASTSEGIFWESLNAAAVNKIPLITCIWDDGFGISVPKSMQTVKASISKALSGFQVDESDEGILIYTVKGWDYPSLCAVFDQVAELVRKDNRTALIHVEELTQPQGHSTSGSHERYKDAARLEWEKDFDCNKKMEEWILKNDIATQQEINEIKDRAALTALTGKDIAWAMYSDPIREFTQKVKGIYTSIENKSNSIDDLERDLISMINPVYSEVIQNLRRLKQVSYIEKITIPDLVDQFLEEAKDIADVRYHSHLYASGPKAAINIPVIPAEYSESSAKVNGYQIINTFFDNALAKYPNMVAFGEDVGQIGAVNQGFAGLQEKYGEHRIFDTGIREWTIMGGAIGAAMRGLRPIAEIQYIDYLLYGLPALSDDLATLRYRSNGIQKAPAIIRTRGHRLEGIWHAGSPMALIINALRGMYVLVPRNMVQAAGFYNTMLQSDDPSIIIECLNGYRLKETMPDNLAEYTLPLGVPEILQKGSDVTLVTYGSCVRIAQKAISMLAKANVSVELIDVQSLLPFDLEHTIVESLMKTNKIVFLDEDMPGGATAYMMKQVLEDQGGYKYLDAAPITITAHSHRPPFGSDGDYFTKPNPEDIYDIILDLMISYNPSKF